MVGFSTRFKQLRISKNITQDDIARQLNVSRSAIGMYEQGKREPDFGVLISIANFFDVDLDYLLGHSDISKNNFIPVSKFSGFDKTLISRFHSSDKLHQIMVLEILGLNKIENLKT